MRHCFRLVALEKKGKVKRNIDSSATYIIEWQSERGKIAFQIDHQGLTAKVNELEVE